MKLYLVQNTDQHRWLVWAHSAEEARSLVPAPMLEPVMTAPSYYGGKLSTVTVDEIVLGDQPRLILACNEPKWWL